MNKLMQLLGVLSVILCCACGGGSGGGGANANNPPASTAPTITVQPASRIVKVGDSATFTVTVAGTAPFTYQWRENGKNIDGAIYNSYTTTATTDTGDTGVKFSVVVMNSVSSVTSNDAKLTVNVTPTVNVSPTGPFPIGVWLQHALGDMGKNGQYDSTNYKNIGINTYVGLWKFPYTGWAEAEDSAIALGVLKEQGIKVYTGTGQKAVDWVSDHPEYADTIVGYLLGDEPDMNKVNVVDPANHLLESPMPDGWKKDGDALRAADSSRGLYANFGKGFALDPWAGYHIFPGPTQADDFAKYVEPLTVLSSDYYGITDPWEGKNEHGIWTYGRAVTNTRKNAGGRPVWGVLEASAPFNEAENNFQGNQHYLAFRMPASYIMPTVWNMVVHGAQGIIYFCHDFSTTRNTGGALGEPDIPAAMREANQSVQQYAAVLATGDVPGTSATTDGAVGVTALTKKLSGVTYIFAMSEGNSSHIYGQAVNATITVAGGGNHTVEVVGENRAITMTNGVLATEHFTAYQLHIYRY